MGNPHAKADVFDSSFCVTVKPRALGIRFAFLLDKSHFQPSVVALPPYLLTVTAQIICWKVIWVLKMLSFWGFSFSLLVSLSLAAPGEDRPIWGGGGGVVQDKDKEMNLDTRTGGQDTEDPFGLRQGLLAR